MNREFENILAECLERVIQGEDIESCLRSYPEQAAELKPLLQTALAARSASCIQPSPEFRARARYQFRHALEQAATKQQRRRPGFGWMPRWATALLLVLGVLTAGGGTVAAAGYSMPDSPLYPVKLATEQVQLGLTRSEVGKAELQMELADRRVNEIVYLANKGDARSIESMKMVTARLDERLDGLAGLLAGGGGAELNVQAPAAAGSQPAPIITIPPMPTPGPTVAATAPSMTMTTPPTPEPAPRVAVAAPTPTTTPSPAPPRAAAATEGTKSQMAGMDKSAQDSKDETPRMKLRAELIRYALTHPAALEKALENAPESAKPALRQALAALLKAYGRSLRALEQP